MKKSTIYEVVNYIQKNKINDEKKQKVQKSYLRNKFSLLRRGIFTVGAISFLFVLSHYILQDSIILVPVGLTFIALLIALIPDIINLVLSRKIKKLNSLNHDDIESLSKIIPREEMNLLLENIKHKKLQNIIDKCCYNEIYKNNKILEHTKEEDNKESLLEHLYKNQKEGDLK